MALHREDEISHNNTTKATLGKFDVTSCNGTTGCKDTMRKSTDSKILPADVNTIDYDIENMDNIGHWGDIVKNITNIISSPLFLNKSQYKTKGTGRNTTMKGRGKGKSTITPNVYKDKLRDKYGTLNRSHPVTFHELSYKKPFRSRRKSPYHSVNVLNLPKSTQKKLAKYTERKTSNAILDDLTSKYAVIKKRSINEQRLKHAPTGFNSVLKSIPLKRSDRNNQGSFKFFGHDSNEEGIDPVSSIFDQELLFGGTKTGHEGTTPFPIVDKDHDYNVEYDAEYDYEKENNPIDEEERKSQEIYEEDKEETFDEYNEEPESVIITKPKENSKVVVNVVKQEENQDDNEDKKEDEDEEMDVIREPPIIVLYKGGDSKQLQPSFEYALTHGGLDPRYLTKEPLAGPLATRGFNHNFQIIRGVPIQGSVVQPGRRYPVVGGFNTTQIHAIIQTGQLPITTTPVNNTSIGVVPPAPADYVSYGRPVNVGQFLEHPYPGNSQYITRPRSPLIIRPKYYGGRGRRPPLMRSPIRSQSAVVLSTDPRYVPYYRGGPFVRYRGNRNHMARYRPLNFAIPRGTRMAFMAKRDSNGDVESSLRVHSR